MNAHIRQNERGFTLVEMIVAMAIMVTVTGVIFSMVDPSRGAYRIQPEVAELQQRLRVGTQFLVNDLMMAGAGSPAGSPHTGTLTNFFAPIQPYRIGMIDSDPENGVYYRNDAITIMYIPPGAPQTTLSDPMPQPSAELKVNDQPNCPDPATNGLCGFKDGQRIIIFDETGAYDDMTLTAVQPASNHLQHNKSVVGNELSKAYTPANNTQIAQVSQQTYWYNAETLQLMYYDGDQRDEAVVDQVVELVFEYFGEPRPPAMIAPITNAVGPWTSYGPKPPPLTMQPTTWPAGENCAFMIGPSGTHVGRLPDLAPGETGLVGLSEEMLTDGPWCPDATFPTRYDADLLRIRKIGVRMRVQVASSELRGPAGTLFRNPGTSKASSRMVPDQEIRFDIVPRNFNLGR
jgi:prepilin-type N-terminal cleavage/methylation domain-containing protein